MVKTSNKNNPALVAKKKNLSFKFSKEFAIK